MSHRGPALLTPAASGRNSAREEDSPTFRYTGTMARLMLDLKGDVLADEKFLEQAKADCLAHFNSLCRKWGSDRQKTYSSGPLHLWQELRTVFEEAMKGFDPAADHKDPTWASKRKLLGYTYCAVCFATFVDINGLTETSVQLEIRIELPKIKSIVSSHRPVGPTQAAPVPPETNTMLVFFRQAFRTAVRSAWSTTKQEIDRKMTWPDLTNGIQATGRIRARQMITFVQEMRVIPRVEDRYNPNRDQDPRRTLDGLGSMNQTWTYGFFKAQGLLYPIIACSTFHELARETGRRYPMNEWQVVLTEASEMVTEALKDHEMQNAQLPRPWAFQQAELDRRRLE